MQRRSTQYSKTSASFQRNKKNAYAGAAPSGANPRRRDIRCATTILVYNEYLESANVLTNDLSHATTWRCLMPSMWYTDESKREPPVKADSPLPNVYAGATTFVVASSFLNESRINSRISALDKAVN